jgi:hypothetical protein
MTATEILIDNPDTLTGFTEHLGIRIAMVGDDGDRFIALGHHDPDLMAKAFIRALRNDAGWHWTDVKSMFETPSGLKDALIRSWGRFTTDDRGDNWWCDWTATTAAPGLVAVTILDCS